MIDNMCGLCLTCWPLPRKSGTACHDADCPCHVRRRDKTGEWATPYTKDDFIDAIHEGHWRQGPIAGCPRCDANVAEDERVTERLRIEYPGYAWPGTEPIEAEDDDEDRIAAVNAPGAHYIDGDGEEWVVGPNGDDHRVPDEEAAAEEWSEYLEWQRGMME